MRGATRARIWLAVRVVAVVATFAGLAFLVRGVDLHALWRAIAAARLSLIAGAVALSFFLMFGKAVRLRVMLAPLRKVGLAQLFRYTVVSFAASTLLPARAGEALRVWLLVRRNGFSAAAVTGVTLSEKIADALAMMLLVAPIPWLLPDPPAWVRRSIVILAVAALLLLLVASRLPRTAARPALARFLDGLEPMRSLRVLVPTMATSLFIWILDAVITWVVLRAVHIDAGAGAALLVLLGVNLAIAMPTTPAHVGAFEVGALVALRALGVPEDAGLAFALVYHALQSLPLAIIGLVELRFILGSLRAEALAAPETAAPAPGPAPR